MSQHNPSYTQFRDLDELERQVMHTQMPVRQAGKIMRVTAELRTCRVDNNKLAIRGRQMDDRMRELERVSELAREFVNADTIDQLRFLQGRMSIALEFLEKAGAADLRVPCAVCGSLDPCHGVGAGHVAPQAVTVPTAASILTVDVRNVADVPRHHADDQELADMGLSS